MTEPPILMLGIILMTASLVAIVSRRLHLPYSAGLVAGGIVLALLPFDLDLPLSRDLIFSVFLPPLVFEAALQLDWPRFRRELPLTAVLAFAGVAIAAAVVAAGTHVALGWSWIGAGLFGALIAATDPVSVIAAFREMKAEPRLALIVESESLLNDGAAAVGFVVLAAAAGGMTASVGGAAAFLLLTVFGGIACGAIVGGAVLLIAGRTKDHMVEITLTTIAAYTSFLLAEHFHMSGVLATLAAGLVVGNLGWRGPISEAGRGHVLAFWEFAAFLANSFVFILIGGHEAHQPLAAIGGAALVAIALVLLGRAVAVYPLSALFAKSDLRLSWGYQHVLFWGGLRGALGLALALALPPTVPERGEIIAVAFAVVAFSIFAQGLTMPWLIRRLGLICDDRAQREGG
ncbi:putative CPA1 family transporter [Sphingomonas changbaiensis NBRC 104936]|uniref:Putative CPA1 family transporter n=1 Tax=Sphingomonas changbaiensis NBRC 104936 TaxID=1219043 RepID=A0A0E9MQC7_9SPHN|nr:sodium:proton antiporter [Sphingomonas changbaiensis]GAO39698.1 putative CPA1 family transporter [Sphingomonas changbaiensis NBRC 104936]